MFIKKSTQPNTTSEPQDPNEAKNDQNNQTNQFGDDSEDDDLLDPTESPAVKQSAAVFMAIRTMVSVVILPIICIVILICYGHTLWAYALVAFLLALIRCPGILFICIFNFGPIRNQVGLYIEDLPDHLKDSVLPFIEHVLGFFARNNLSNDERNIVEVGDERGTNSPTNDGQTRLNVVGERESAVSPSPTPSMIEKLPEVNC